MIVLRATRVEDDGAETELGEVRLVEMGSLFSYTSTSVGAGVIADLRARLDDRAPGVRAANGRAPWPGGRA